MVGSAGMQVGEAHIGCLKGNREKIKDRHAPRSGVVETKVAMGAGKAKKKDV